MNSAAPHATCTLHTWWVDRFLEQLSMMTRKRFPKNSLVGNINKRKRAGTSRPKSASTISKAAYRELQQGWPKSKRKKRAKRK